jgi:hypothetical protein
MSRDVREVVHTAVGRLAPGELPRFGEIWSAYLENPQDTGQILRPHDAELGAGIDIIGMSLTPLVAAIVGEALAGMAKEPAEGAARKLAGHLGAGGRRRKARQQALSGPAPDPASLERAVMRALFLDIALKARCPDDAAARVAEALADVFTEKRTS